MKIPKQVTILGRKFKVKQVSTKYIQSLHPRAIGLCDVYNDVIYLDKTLPTQAKIRTYIHECGHAFMDVIGIDQNLNSNENEIYAQCLSAFVQSMLKK